MSLALVTTEPTASLEPRLDQLEAEIRAAHSEVQRGLRYSAWHSIRAGKVLIAAKKKVKHGQWQEWVARRCDLGLRMVQIYMYLARHEDQLRQLLAAETRKNSFLSQDEAVKFLSSAKQKKRRRAKKPS